MGLPSPICYGLAGPGLAGPGWVVSSDSAGGGYLTMGIAGGTGGLVCGGSIGALVGLAPAPFTAGQGGSDGENSRRRTRFNQISGELL